MALFQTFSRNNDANGNPYRLLLVYSSEGGINEAYEARSSSPKIAATLRKTHNQLPSFHLSPAEYNETKKQINVTIEQVN